MSCPIAKGDTPPELPPDVEASISGFCSVDYTALIPFIGSQIADAKRPQDPSISLQSATEQAQEQLVQKQEAFQARLATLVASDVQQLQDIINELQSKDGYLNMSIAVAAQPLLFSQIRLAIYLASLGIVLTAVVLMYS